MSQDIIKPNKGTALLLAAFLGPLGADKFYVGATSLGVTQLILSICIIGLLVSIPWAFISVIGITIALLYSRNSVSLGYPTVDWAPQTDTDKYIAYVLIGLFILSIVVGIIAGGIENFEKKKEEEKKKNQYLY